MNIKDSYIHNGTAVLKDIKIENSVLKKILAGKDANDAYLDWTTVLDLTTIKPTNAGNADTLGSYAESAFLHLTGGTMTGKINLSYNASNILDDTKGLNFGLIAHIGISDNFGIYTTGQIILRPNQTWGSANTNGLVITSSAITYNGNSLLHAGNYTSYVYSKSTSDGRYVYKAGDTMTGALTVPSLTVTGASSFSQAINASILGNAATASKLLNARTITIGSESNSFDGSGNISFTLAQIGALAAGNYKTVQTAVATVGASTNTLTFINSISQDTNGVITATTGVVRDASTSLAGVVNTTTQSFAGAKTFTGNVVIGSTSTNATLQVHGTTTFETTSYGTQLEIWRRADSANAIISYYNGTTKTLLGYIGISGDTFSGVSSYGRPYWYNGTTNYQLVHSTAKTAVGGTTTPVYVDANGQVQSCTAYSSASVNYATSSGSADKLSTVSKTAWGKTYWTANGVPDSISGDMSNVGNISLTGDNVTKSLGASDKAWLNIYGEYITSNTTLYLTSASSTSIIFRPQGTERARFNTSGNLILGLTSGLNDITNQLLYVNGATTITGTLILSKTQDLSGTVDNKPALIVGGSSTEAHLEIDSNEIQAKENGTTVKPLYLNYDGGLVYSRGKVIAEQNSTTTTANKIFASTTTEGRGDWIDQSSITAGYASKVGTSGTAGTNYVTAANVISMYTWYTTAAGTSASGVIDNWNEIKNFVDGFHETDDLAEYLVNTFIAKTGGTMTGTLTTPSLTVTGAATFSLTINGSILGNATTASRLQNARTISLTGSVTGSGSFDGSGNLSIATTTNHSHSYVNTIGKDGKKITWSINGTAQTALDFSTTFAPYNSNGYLPLNGGTISSSEKTPLIIDSTSNSECGIRFTRNGVAKGWIGYVDSGGMSFWNTARSNALRYGDDGTLKLEGNLVWHAGNDGTDSGLDADLLDGYEASALVKYDGGTTEQTIKSSISSLSKGVINLWRNSGDHYTFLGFSNGTTETYLGGIGFKSQSDHNLYRKDGSNYYKIFDENNYTTYINTTNFPGLNSVNSHTYTSTWTALTANANLPIAISPNATPATSGNGFKANFTYNPSTNTLSVPNITSSGSTTLDDATIGNLVVTGGASFALTINGNIKSADKVNHTLTFTGGVTGTFNGSADKSVAIPTKSSWNYDDVYLKLSGGTLSNANFGQLLIIERSGSTNMAAIGFKNSSGILGYLATNTVNGAFVRYNAAASSYYTILDESNHYSVGVVTKTAANYSLSSGSWVDSGITFPTVAGSYVLTLISGNLTATGLFSVGTSDAIKDEIALHLHGPSTYRLYARTDGNKLYLASSDSTAASRNITIKYKRLI